MTPDPPTQAEGPARVAIPEALARDVAARPEAYRPPAAVEHLTVLLLDGPDAGLIGPARLGSTAAGRVQVDQHLATAWALVGTTAEGLRPGLRVLVLDAEAPGWRGRIVDVTGGPERGRINIEAPATRWAILPPAPDASQDAPGSPETAERGSAALGDAPAPPEPAETVSPNPLRNRCPQCQGTTEGTGRIITALGTRQCPDPFHATPDVTTVVERIQRAAASDHRGTRRRVRGAAPGRRTLVEKVVAQADGLQAEVDQLRPALQHLVDVADASRGLSEFHQPDLIEAIAAARNVLGVEP